ncbi:MAG: hypothetical protein A2Z03_00890 [Chloroflexi bacterium RBG_16_56_8]|nr:MAG: hypothetical protein A2Z03_00890 [Chloroflexi bacterium RBG_16_56_8]
MRTAEGQLVEVFLDEGGRILCPADLIPAPGQYLLAYADAPDQLLPASIFSAESISGGFLAAPPLPPKWSPGTHLHLRGPLGHGFSLPATARRVALVAYDVSPARLRGLIAPAFAQEAAIVIVGDTAPLDLPESVEIQPLTALAEVYAWADYVALDVARGGLPELREKLRLAGKTAAKNEAQVLVRTPLPCGALAECGVCAVTVGSGWRAACKDGPVFELRELTQ